jgi:hypothetical protein
LAEREEISIVEEIQRLASSDPFVPFSIVMGSGQRYDISEGDYIAFGRSVLMLMLHRRGASFLRQSQISEVNVSGELPWTT